MQVLLGVDPARARYSALQLPAVQTVLQRTRHGRTFTLIQIAGGAFPNPKGNAPQNQTQNPFHRPRPEGTPVESLQ
jgi:hypothetical protein